MGDGAGGTDDFGRERAQTRAPLDRYRYRTPSLLNVELTAPYGHAGAYVDLLTTVSPLHPARGHGEHLRARSRSGAACRPFVTQPNCQDARQTVSDNTFAALDRVLLLRLTAPLDAIPGVDTTQFSPTVSGQIAAFMRTLTDPCLRDRACFGRWIPAPGEAPDEHQLNATDASGNPL